MDPDINSPRAQQWNVTVEQQLGTSWGVSASYLGSYADRLWAQTALNPGVFLGLGPCTLNTVRGRSRCARPTANLNQRRVMSLQDPIKSAQDRRARSQLGRRLAEVSWPEAGGAASDRRRREPQRQLHAVEVRRARRPPTTFNQTSAGYTDPDNPDLDAGYCDQDRKHLATLNMGYQTPEVGNGVVHALASNWRRVGHPQRALGEPAQHHQWQGQRVQRHRGAAAGPGPGKTSMVRAKMPRT